MCVITVRSLSPTAPPSRPRSRPPGQGKGPSQAQLLMAMAEDTYRLIRSADGRAYAVPKMGPQIAVPLASRSGNSIRARLAASLHRQTGKVASASALADCITVLDGRGQRAGPPAGVAAGRPARRHGRGRHGHRDRPVHHHHPAPAGPCEADSPVIFRRSELTHPLVQPERGGTLDALREPDQPARGGLPAGHRLGGGRLPDRHPAPHPAGPRRAGHRQVQPDPHPAGPGRPAARRRPDPAQRQAANGPSSPAPPGRSATTTSPTSRPGCPTPCAKASPATPSCNGCCTPMTTSACTPSSASSP